MKMSEIEKMLDEIGIPYRYHHFKTKEAVSPPFICYLYPESDNYFADGEVYQKINRLYIELYTDEKNLENEIMIETVLDKYGFCYEKDETWIESEELYQVIYEMEVI